MIKADSEVADTLVLTCITCYSIQIGLLYPLKVLKLTVNFNEGATTFIPLLETMQPYQHYYVGVCISYVMKHIERT